MKLLLRVMWIIAAIGIARTWVLHVRWMAMTDFRWSVYTVSMFGVLAIATVCIVIGVWKSMSTILPTEAERSVKAFWALWIMIAIIMAVAWSMEISYLMSFPDFPSKLHGVSTLGTFVFGTLCEVIGFWRMKSRLHRHRS